MKHIQTLSNALKVAGFSTFLLFGIHGCSSNENNQASESQAKGAFVVIEEVAPKKYKIKEEFPANETRIILKELNGTERVLSKEEMDKLIKQEAAKIENNSSNLTNPNAQIENGGLSLGEAILASAAGAIIGSWIGNKLFNNPAYQKHRQTAYKSPSAYYKSVESFKKGKVSTTKRSGFFSSKSTKKSGFFGKFGG